MILNAEKKRMTDEINEEIDLFDKDLTRCQNEKNMLESEMTICKMKLLTQYQELMVLGDMEEQDNKLIQNLVKCKKQKEQLKRESDEIQAKLKKLAEDDANNEKLLNDELQSFKDFVYPEDDHKREKIHQFYLKKWKKQQAKTQMMKKADEEGEEVNEDQIAEDEDDDDDFLEDDDDEKPDTSPVENDPKIRDIMDKICEYECNQENYRKDKSDLDRQKAQKATQISNLLNQLKVAETQLKNYQRSKLQRVNQLDVTYCLKVDQIQNLVTENDHVRMPNQLDGSILFTKTEYERLNNRISELVTEQQQIQKQKDILDRKKKYLEKQINLKEQKFTELNKKYEEKHILKFGDIIDLKVLDALQPTKQVLEMREKFKLEEKDAIKRIEKAKLDLLDKKKELLKAKKQNTNIIKDITELGEKQMNLNKKLDSTNKQLFKEENEEKKHKNDLDRERQNL